MNIALWVIQSVLSLLMISLGVMKAFQPVGQLNKFSWTTRSSTAFVRFVGVSELLIGLGLVLPQLTGILPILTPIAAFALYLVMVFAIREHVRQNEMNDVWKNIIIMLLAVFVVAGRIFTGAR